MQKIKRPRMLRGLLKRKSAGEKAVYIIVFIIFCLYAFTLIYPVLWAFMSSFKDEVNYLDDMVGLPWYWQFSNYVDAFTELGNLFAMFLNSGRLAFGGAALGVFISSMSAYVVAKYKFFGRKTFYMVALVIMMLPIVGALPSQYEVYSNLGILNTPFMLITYCSGMGFNFLVLYGYFTSLPWDYVEASFIDGGNHFNTFFQIMLPQAKGVILSLGIVAFINIWNDYNTPILFLESYPTLSSGIYIYQQDILQTGINIPMLFAGVFMSVIPVLVLFVLFQNKIMEISIGGGLKG